MCEAASVDARLREIVEIAAECGPVLADVLDEVVAEVSGAGGSHESASDRTLRSTTRERSRRSESPIAIGQDVDWRVAAIHTTVADPRVPLRPAP